MAEIRSNDIEWKTNCVERFAKKTRSVDVAVLDKQDPLLLITSCRTYLIVVAVATASKSSAGGPHRKSAIQPNGKDSQVKLRTEILRRLHERRILQG